MQVVLESQGLIEAISQCSFLDHLSKYVNVKKGEESKNASTTSQSKGDIQTN